MGVFDELAVECPVCLKTYVYQSKWGPCELATYTLENAPLSVIADINDDGKQGRLFCEHCGAQLEVPVKFVATIRATNFKEDLTWREE